VEEKNGGKVVLMKTVFNKQLFVVASL